MITSIGALFTMASTGMLANQMRMDVIADNLSNAHTTGFKNRDVQFSEALMIATQDGEENVMAHGARVLSVTADHTQGSLSPSDQSWHMAIEGAGFFEIRLPDGTTAYTRDGHFQVDAAGQLVTTAGYPLADPVTIPQDADGVTVNPDGTLFAQVTFTDDDNHRVTENREIGRIGLVGFRNPQGLDRIGGNLYLPTAASGPAVRGVENLVGEIIGSALESSNVNMVDEMTNLVSAQRAYSVCTRLMHTVDEMVRGAHEMIR